MSSDPLEFFKKEATHEEAPVRTEAMNRVVLIAAVLGAEAIRESLVPFLVSRVSDLDQVTLALSKKVGDLVPRIGGPEHTACLIPLLELLCSVEETTVRVAITASISKILLSLSMPDHAIQINEFYEMFLRLGSEDIASPGETSSGEIFCSRVAAALIIPELYAVMPEDLKAQLLDLYSSKLLADELAIVKRAAASSFLKTLQYCNNPRVKQVEFLKIFKLMLADPEPTMKIIAVEQLASLATNLKDAGGCEAVLSQEILPMVDAAVKDPSWMVRRAITQRYGSFSRCFTREDVAASIFPGLMSLLEDPEPEVRALALKEMLAFLDVVGHVAYLDIFIPTAVLLADDSVADSRKVLTLLLVDIATRVRSDLVASHLSDLIMRLTVDEDPLVRLRVLQRMDALTQEAPAVCQRLTDPLKTMLGDSNWRVRKQAALCCPSIMKNMGKEYFETHYLQPLLELLRDGVDQVRSAAATALPKISPLGGEEWASEHIFPAIRAMSSCGHMIRISMLTALQGVVVETDVQGAFQGEALALLVAASNDKVPNVRLRAAQVLGAVCTAIGPEASRLNIRPVLQELQQDKDRDVVFFATEALRHCG